MTVFNIISIFGGLALFLYGMRIMGDALKKESSGSFKVALEKVTGSPVMGFIIGMGLTALIQSSTATIVIVSGLVGAGIMTLNQSIGVIIGANVGTTITGQIIRLMDVDAQGTQWLNFFKPDTLAPVAAIIGIVFIMFVKKSKSNSWGTIAMGFGILFTGLINMTAAVAPLSGSEQFAGLFLSLGNRPVLGFLVGFAVSFVLQSSSATVGILQALSVTGALTFSAVYPMICGIYLGDCVTTAIVCSIGTKDDAKRTGIVNILFNLTQIVIIIVGVNIAHSLGAFSQLWESVLNSGGIANVHTIFKLGSGIILLPLSGRFVQLAKRIVKDDPNKIVRGAEIEGLDEALFKSPALALNSTYKALCAMDNTVCGNLDKAISLLDKYDAALVDVLKDDEEYLDELEDSVNAYLAKLSSYLSAGLQEDIQNYYLLCVTDFERAGDHIYGIVSACGEARDKKVKMSGDAREELAVVLEALHCCLEKTSLAFTKQNLDSAKQVEAYVFLVNELADACRDKHMQRMKKGSCDGVSGSIFLDILMHLGRIADMCSNIAIHTLVRHNSGIENYEHKYMAALRHGDNEEYNLQLDALEGEYLKRING